MNWEFAPQLAVLALLSVAIEFSVPFFYASLASPAASWSAPASASPA